MRQAELNIPEERMQALREAMGYFGCPYSKKTV
jgi:hypothetical protein